MASNWLAGLLSLLGPTTMNSRKVVEPHTGRVYWVNQKNNERPTIEDAPREQQPKTLGNYLPTATPTPKPLIIPTWERRTFPTPTQIPISTPTPRPTITPTPTRQPAILNDYVNPKPVVTPTPMMSPNLTPIENKQMNGVVDYYRNRKPNVKAEDWYPMWNDIPYMYQKEQELGRPGLGTLLALIPIWEANGGRNPKTGEIDMIGGKPNRNVYRALIGGEKLAVQPEFETYRDAIDYALSKSMFGGGANSNMNILKNKGPITTEEITKLYESYNPSGDYLRPLLDMYSNITGIY